TMAGTRSFVSSPAALTVSGGGDDPAERGSSAPRGNSAEGPATAAGAPLSSDAPRPLCAVNAGPARRRSSVRRRGLVPADAAGTRRAVADRGVLNSGAQGGSDGGTAASVLAVLGTSIPCTTLDFVGVPTARADGEIGSRGGRAGKGISACARLAASPRASSAARAGRLSAAL